MSSRTAPAAVLVSTEPGRVFAIGAFVVRAGWEAPLKDAADSALGRARDGYRTPEL